MKKIKWCVLFIFAVSLLTSSLHAGTPSSVKGTVRNADGTPAAGLAVKAFNKGMRNMTLLGQARTDARGYYMIRYAADGDVTLVVRVFDAAGRQIHESRPVMHASNDQTVDIAITLALSPARPERVIADPIQEPAAQNSFSVKGTVSYVDGNPAAGLTVRALHKTTRSLRTLGRAQTDDSGYYMIRYSPDDDITLVVRVFDTAERQIYESRPVMHALGDQIVDVVLTGSVQEPVQEPVVKVPVNNNTPLLHPLER